jgi:23S rRNA pseudouridine2605 synthase
MKKKTGFEKFISPKTKGSVKKEQIRQEKKKITKQRKEYFENKRVEARGVTAQKAEGPKPVILKRETEDKMPLNKYIAHAGICSRRDAVDVIKSGKVKVNGVVVMEPGHKVLISDAVIVNGKKIQPVQDLVYILLNKPKDYITTTDDDKGRKNGAGPDQKSFTR